MTEAEYLKIDRASVVRHEYMAGKMWAVGHPPGSPPKHWSYDRIVSAQPHPLLTEEEYLKLDRANPFKSEFFEGRMYPMAGGTIPHALIIGNLTGELRSALRDRPCAVMPNDLRVRITPGTFWTYPDIVVVCGEMQVAAIGRTRC